MVNLWDKFQHLTEPIALKFKVALGNMFYALGMFVGRYPVIVALAALLFSGLCGIGLINNRTETRPEKLWSSDSSEFIQQKNYFDDAYGAFYRLNLVLITPKVPGSDVINRDILVELWNLDQTIRSIRVDDPEEDVEIDIDLVCAHVYDNSPCLINTVLDYWDSLSDIETDPNLHLTVSDGSKRAPYGPYLDPTNLMGLLEYSGSVISKSQAFLVTYLLNGTQNDVVDMKRKSELWEELFIDTVLNFNQTTTHINIYFQAERSIEDTLASEIAADTKYIAISYVLMFIYTIFAIGKLDPVESKVLVGIAAVILEVLAIVISLGITSAGDLPMSPITLQVIPFLVLGIGINDVFVMTAIFVDTPIDTSLPAAAAQRKRLAESLKTIGPSILLTSSTNVTSFLVGAATVIPAVRDFSFQAAFAMAMSMFLLLTLYSALLVLDGIRIQQNRYDVLFCLTSKRSQDNKTSGFFKKDFLKLFLVKYFMPFLSIKAVKVVVLVVIALLFGGGIFGATQVEKGLGITDVVPTDSYVADFLDQRAIYFANLGAPVYIVFRGGDYTDFDTQDKLDEFYQKMLSSKWFHTPTASWYDTFSFWVRSFGGHSSELIAGRIPPQKFYEWLHEFLEDRNFGTYFTFDIKFDEEGKIETSRFITNSIGLNITDDYIGAIEYAQTLTEETDLDCFPYSLFYIFFEQYLLIEGETIRGILSALAVIFVVSCLFLMHLGAAFIVLIVIAMIEVEFIGIMYFWDIDLNAISAVNLVMGTGIAVSFTSYITLAFLESNKPTREERIQDSMANVGASVLNGAITTIIGVFLLAFAEYNLFRTYYFKMYMAIVLIGIIYGFFFLPVLLSLIGPSYTSKILNRNQVTDQTSLTELSPKVETQSQTEEKMEQSDSIED